MASGSQDRPSMHHDWHSEQYVTDWIAHDVTRDGERRPRLQQMLAAAPYPREADIEVLDVGGGYGVVTEELLKRFPKARVTLQDYSQPMLAEARRRLAAHAAQLTYVTVDRTRLGAGSRRPVRFGRLRDRTPQSARPGEDLRFISRDLQSAETGRPVSRLRPVLCRRRRPYRRIAQRRLRVCRMSLARAAARDPGRLACLEANGRTAATALVFTIGNRIGSPALLARYRQTTAVTELSHRIPRKARPSLWRRLRRLFGILDSIDIDEIDGLIAKFEANQRNIQQLQGGIVEFLRAQASVPFTPAP